MRVQGEPEAATVRPKTKDDRGQRTDEKRGWKMLENMKFL